MVEGNLIPTKKYSKILFRSSTQAIAISDKMESRNRVHKAIACSTWTPLVRVLTFYNEKGLSGLRIQVLLSGRIP